jgi:DtxR family Mn-dependent transcriptional regulator
MARDGLISLDARKIITLTAKGRELAEDITRRHRLAERFLVDVMGLGWAEAHEEAHHFEHAITPRLEKKIFELAGNPKTCPHGSPIPGTGAKLAPDLVPLSSLKAGDQGTLIFISEELEEDMELLQYLERSRMIPGSPLRVAEHAPTGVMIIDRDGREVPLGLAVAAKIRVRPGLRGARKV